MNFRKSLMNSPPDEGQNLNFSIADSEENIFLTASLQDSASNECDRSFISMSSESSSDANSEEIDKIKLKNSEMINTFRKGIERLKHRSNQMIFSYTEETSEKEEYRNRVCASVEPKTMGICDSMQELRNFVTRVKDLNITIDHSRKWIKKELVIIQEVTEENEELKKRLEEIANGISEESSDNCKEKCGCILI